MKASFQELTKFFVMLFLSLVSFIVLFVCNNWQIDMPNKTKSTDNVQVN